jgi:nitrous oxidase accessory protein
MRHSFALLLFITITVSAISAKNRVIKASDGVQLQTAFDEAIAFDTLWLKGDFEASLLKVEKPLYLFGQDGASISARNGEEILIIASNQVQVKNLIFKNVEASFLKDQAAVRLLEVKDVLIDSNRFLNTFFGVYVQNSNDCIISHNLFQGEAADEVHAGNAIHIWQAKRIEVIQNKAYGHRDGIYFEFVDESYIQGNVSINNMRYGLHFMFSNYDIYEDNHFENNGSGVAVMFSKHIRMINNTFRESWGGASYGILLKEISDGTMKHNRFELNTVGVYAEGANRIQIDSNVFISNGKALDIKGNCVDNEIVNNNFLGNTFEVLTNSKGNLNFFEGNYWGQYKGYDLNRDGVGDVPHRPVNLFALITDKIPAASMLLHSPLVHSLDMAERVFPQLIPAQLIDEKPQMKPLRL